MSFNNDKMKYAIILLTLLIFGCNHKGKTIEAIDYSIPPPPPPPNILPPTPPPPFEPSTSELAEIQINPLPHPFNLNGSIPYAVWLNGKKLKLNNQQVRSLAASLNLEFKQPANTAQIHNGEGWLYPLNLKGGNSQSENPFISNKNVRQNLRQN